MPRLVHCRGPRAFAAAFTADPNLADDLKRSLRYNAACLAAQAGCGKDRHSPALDERERARCRRQALAWLRADEAAWTKLADDANERSIRQSLHHWQQDVDLADICDDQELA